MNIIIKPDVFEKIMYWVDKADFEVSGFGTVKYNGTDFVVTDAILLKQEGGAVHTDIDPEALSKAQYDLRNADGDLRFWWHSHVDMQAFMSGTDTATIKEIAQAGWCVAAVFNKRREYQTALGYINTTPFGGNVLTYQEKLPLLIQTPLSVEEKNELDRLFDERVTRKSPIMTFNDYLMNSDKGPAAMKKDAKVEQDALAEAELVEEARALGIKPNKWEKIRRKCTPEQLDKYYDKLDSYFQAKYVYNRYNMY